VRGIPFKSTRAHFASARLDELRAVGARIALDVFGTGYSSLSYLRNFPIDVLKVDKSFIDDIASDTENANLARAIIELGRTMNSTLLPKVSRIPCRSPSWCVCTAAWGRDSTSPRLLPLTN
jgi:hypothetical protein